MALLTMMSNVAIVTALPHLSQEYSEVKHIELLSRLMLTLPSFIVAIFAPFASKYIYNIGLKRSAIIALVIFVLAGSSGLFIYNIYLLLASRMLFGVGVAVLMIVSTSLVGNLFHKEDRDKFMSLQMAFTALGGMVFVFLGGFLSDIHYNYAFGVYLVGIAILAMVVWHIPDDEDIKKPSFASVTLNPNIYKIYILGFIVSALFFLLPTQFPFLLINHFHASGKLTALIISSAFIANALGSLTFRVLHRYMGYGEIYYLGLCVMATAMILIGHIDNPYMFFISSPMIGFSAGLLMTTISVWMLSFTNETNRIKSVSYLTMSMFAGQFLSPILTYPLSTVYGVKNLFDFMGYTILISLSMMLIYTQWLSKKR